MSNYAILSDRGVLKVSGEEAFDFLQGLITNNMEKLKGQPAIHTGLLIPQGKILFEFFVIVDADQENAYWLDCRKDQTAELLKRLTFYKLRSKVDLSVEDGLVIAVCWNKDCGQLEASTAFVDPRFEKLGHRAVMAQENAQKYSSWHGEENLAAWHHHRIQLGVPEAGLDFGWSEVFAHEANYDLLAGVDFKKGCYVGQEVVSRMQHKTSIRKRYMPVELASTGETTSTGDEIRAGGSLIGHLGSIAGKDAIAYLRFDRLQKANENGEPMQTGETLVKLKSPEWTDLNLMEADEKA